MSERGLAPRTVARKLAGLRACFRVLVEHGLMEANPAELLASPKLPQRLPRALKPADVSALLDRIPAATPLEQRDRALFELAYACGLRAEELVRLDVGSWTSTRSSCAWRARAARRGSSRSASTPSPRSPATWSAPGAPWTPGG
jgi:integrase/recombinase XerC/integrase/recombinase XerD